MRVLIACEFSGVVRDAFTARGHDAWSCDLLPSETPGQHHTGPLEDWIGSGREWDLIIGHPPCTYLSNSGARWLYGGKGSVRDVQRWSYMESACAFFNMIRNRDCKRVCIENPIPHKYAVELIGKNYSQIIQPWQFGHNETKATCLWLRGLPELKPSNIVSGRTPRVHFASPGPDRWKERSRTLPGIAKAMAEQWG
jgi:hypothetical protein